MHTVIVHKVLTDASSQPTFHVRRLFHTGMGILSVGEWRWLSRVLCKHSLNREFVQFFIRNLSYLNMQLQFVFKNTLVRSPVT